MTKYILHGGGSTSNPEFKQDLYTLLKTELAGNKKLLLVYFANPEALLQQNIEDDRISDAEFLPGIQREIAQKEIFLEQVARNDLIYLKGGDSFQLLAVLKSYPELEKALQGKTILGKSAGACALSRNFFSNDEQRIAPGLGLINANIICHYRAETHIKVLPELMKLGDEKTQLLLIPEGTIVSIEK